MNMFKSTHHFLDEKKEVYELPSTRIIHLHTSGAMMQAVSNGQNLTMRAYGSGAGEEAEGFWD